MYGAHVPLPTWGLVRARIVDIAVIGDCFGGAIGDKPPPEAVVAAIEAVVERATTVGCYGVIVGCSIADAALTLGANYDYATMSGRTGDAVGCNGDVAEVEALNGEGGPPTLCVVPAFSTSHGGHVKARIAAIEEVAGGTAGKSVVLREECYHVRTILLQ